MTARSARRIVSAWLLVLSLAAACGGKVEPGCYVYDDQKCVNGACTAIGDGKCHALCDASTPCSDPNDYCAFVPLFEGRSYCSTQTATFCIGKDAGVPTDCIK